MVYSVQYYQQQYGQEYELTGKQSSQPHTELRSLKNKKHTGHANRYHVEKSDPFR